MAWALQLFLPETRREGVKVDDCLPFIHEAAEFANEVRLCSAMYQLSYDSLVDEQTRSRDLFVEEQIKFKIMDITTGRQVLNFDRLPQQQNGSIGRKLEHVAPALVRVSKEGKRTIIQKGCILFQPYAGIPH